jgi:hypothetical protein
VHDGSRFASHEGSSSWSSGDVTLSSAVAKDKRKIFFSEEKKQKTFANWTSRNNQHAAVIDGLIIKVFWFFSSEKNSLPFTEAKARDGHGAAQTQPWLTLAASSEPPGSGWWVSLKFDDGAELPVCFHAVGEISGRCANGTC